MIRYTGRLLYGVAFYLSETRLYKIRMPVKGEPRHWAVESSLGGFLRKLEAERYCDPLYDRDLRKCVIESTYVARDYTYVHPVEVQGIMEFYPFVDFCILSKRFKHAKKACD